MLLLGCGLRREDLGHQAALRAHSWLCGEGSLPGYLGTIPGTGEQIELATCKTTTYCDSAGDTFSTFSLSPGRVLMGAGFSAQNHPAPPRSEKTRITQKPLGQEVTS